MNQPKQAPAPASAVVDNKEAPAQQELRVLVDNVHVGAIIGKNGANVKNIRENTGVGLSILKTDASAKQVKERVMVLKGQTSQIAKALHLVAERMVEAAAERKDAKSKDDKENKEQTITLRLLVHRYAVGAIIGRQGAVIKETQQETTARVQVSNEPLPQSTEKTVSVTGTPNSVHTAISRILAQLRENQPNKPQRVTHYVPGQQLMVPPVYGSFSPYQAQLMYQNQATPYGAQPTSRQEIGIPTSTAGSIIGRGGAVIRDIRLQSGTQISIADAEPNGNERIVTVQGSPQGISTAIYLIRQLVEQ
jgi:predicted RNA-binding protein YlqC (UPF0109 family)